MKKIESLRDLNHKDELIIRGGFSQHELKNYALFGLISAGSLLFLNKLCCKENTQEAKPEALGFGRSLFTTESYKHYSENCMSVEIDKANEAMSAHKAKLSKSGLYLVNGSLHKKSYRSEVEFIEIAIPQKKFYKVHKSIDKIWRPTNKREKLYNESHRLINDTWEEVSEGYVLPKEEKPFYKLAERTETMLFRVNKTTGKIEEILKEEKPFYNLTAENVAMLLRFNTATGKIEGIPNKERSKYWVYMNEHDYKEIQGMHWYKNSKNTITGVVDGEYIKELITGP